MLRSKLARPVSMYRLDMYSEVLKWPDKVGMNLHSKASFTPKGARQSGISEAARWRVREPVQTGCLLRLAARQREGGHLAILCTCRYDVSVLLPNLHPRHHRASAAWRSDWLRQSGEPRQAAKNCSESDRPCRVVFLPLSPPGEEVFPALPPRRLPPSV